jgi:3'-phosphoadenosine 5'-phosphosulfate (PAPS) 3'-phosphatase
MHPMLTIAVKAARRAGNVINRGARELDLLTITSKGPKDFVSEVDREAERMIVETLLGSYPDTRFWQRKAPPKAPTPTRKTSGSSTRSTARPTSCTAFRSSAFRSRSRTAARSRTA